MQSEWTLVRDKPHPEHGGQVLVSFYVGASGPFVTTARFDCGRWDWGRPAANQARVDSDIDAWQPLPQGVQRQKLSRVNPESIYKPNCAACGTLLHWYEGLGWCEDTFGSPACLVSGGHKPKGLSEEEALVARAGKWPERLLREAEIPSTQEA